MNHLPQGKALLVYGPCVSDGESCHGAKPMRPFLFEPDLSGTVRGRRTVAFLRRCSMRIVSLLPAATDWLVAFGAAEDVVGRSHACDAPAVRHAAVLTRPAIPVDGDSAEIDHAVRTTLEQGLSVFDLDLDALRALQPDLVVTQAQCAVCAVPLATLEERLAEGLGDAPRLVSLEPRTFKETLDAGLGLGRAAGRFARAMEVVGEGEARLRALHERLGRRRDGTLAGRAVPTVACIEWMEPIMTAGHWMPDLVDLAGGHAVCAEAGARSDYVTWDALRQTDPDVLVVAACGFTLEQTRRDLHLLTARPGWDALRAVRSGRVYLFDGDAYFNRPGPGLYRSVELLAAALHGPAACGDGTEPEPWEMERLALTPSPNA